MMAYNTIYEQIQPLRLTIAGALFIPLLSWTARCLASSSERVPLENVDEQAYNVRMTRATMPVELRRAHQANDKAVMQAYGFWGSVKTESECVARLMEMYAGMMK